VKRTVCLLHPDPGLPVTAGRVARHYLAFSEGEVADRVAQHLSGRGSPLLAALIAAGAAASVERTWREVERNFERALKRRHETPRPCPLCVSAAHTHGHGLLLERFPSATRAVRAGGASL
jgi:hypothetical protein